MAFRIIESSYSITSPRRARYLEAIRYANGRGAYTTVRLYAQRRAYGTVWIEIIKPCRRRGAISSTHDIVNEAINTGKRIALIMRYLLKSRCKIKIIERGTKVGENVDI